MLKKINTSEDIKLFKKAIKKEIKDVAKYTEYNIGDHLAIELFNDGDDYICHIVGRPNLQSCCGPDLRIINKGSIVIEYFMYGNGFALNKYTSDYKLRKVADRIINEYNSELNQRENLDGYVAPDINPYKNLHINIQELISDIKSYIEEIPNCSKYYIFTGDDKQVDNNGRIINYLLKNNGLDDIFYSYDILSIDGAAEELFNDLFIKDDTVMKAFKTFALAHNYVDVDIKLKECGSVKLPIFTMYKNIDINVK